MWGETIQNHRTHKMESKTYKTRKQTNKFKKYNN